MSCEKFEQWIALYVENDLPEDQAHGVEAHLQTCVGCREFAAGMRESQTALKALRTEFLDDSVYRAVRGEVLSRLPARSKAITWRRYAVAAGLAVALFAGWLERNRPVTPLQPLMARIPPASLETSRAPKPMHARRHRSQIRPSFKSEPLVVKMITDDPQVVIYWLVDQNGG